MAASEDGEVEKVARRFEGEADDLQRRSEEVQTEIETTRQDWQRKRGDASVPGAVPEESDQDDERAEGSPGPEAPPEDASPGAAEAPDETAVGPPADAPDEDAHR